MKTSTLSLLLLRLRDDGISLRVDSGDLVVSPGSRLAPELRKELRIHKAELLKALTWDEEAAYTLLKNALAYLAEFRLQAKSLDYDPISHWRHHDRIDEAFAAEDMFALRIAVWEYFQDGAASFRAHQKDKGAA